MAIKKIEIRPKGDGTYSDVLYPRTSIDQVDGLQASLDGKEPAFTKNTAFNKNFGTTAGTVCQGNDSRLSDARTPTAHNHSATEITSGTLPIARGGTGGTSASTARNNLGVAQTRVYNGQLQYYDGGWKDVGGGDMLNSKLTGVETKELAVEPNSSLDFYNLSLNEGFVGIYISPKSVTYTNVTLVIDGITVINNVLVHTLGLSNNVVFVPVKNSLKLTIKNTHSSATNETLASIYKYKYL